MTSSLHHGIGRTGGGVAAHESVPLNGALGLEGVQPNGLLLTVVERRTRSQESWFKRLLCHLIS